LDLALAVSSFTLDRALASSHSNEVPLIVNDVCNKVT
jgi:hypothetical protein